ncbi:hypothetical protein COOONC_19252, partial [Cooperia oncophora]
EYCLPPLSRHCSNKNISNAVFSEDSYREPCSGFLISSRHILTAAHCATNFDHDLAELECLGGISDYEPSTSVPKDFIVYVGTRCNPPENCKTTYPVTKVILDSKWKRCVKGKDDEFMVNKNDFAILELKNDVSTKDAIPICLPNSQTALAKHLQVTGSGWEKENSENPGYKVATVPTIKEDKREMILGKSNDTSICPVSS